MAVLPTYSKKMLPVGGLVGLISPDSNFWRDIGPWNVRTFWPQHDIVLLLIFKVMDLG